MVLLAVALAAPAGAQPGRASHPGTNRSGAPAAPTSRSDWTQFHYTYSRSGYTPFERKLDPSNVSGLREAWRFRTGASVDSSPAVVGGVVYAGSDDGRVYAIDAVAGTEVWAASARARVRSSPAVTNGVVYVGAADDAVYAFDAATGARLWRYSTGANVRGSLAVVNGVVYVGSDDNSPYAFALPPRAPRADTRGTRPR